MAEANSFIDANKYISGGKKKKKKKKKKKGRKNTRKKTKNRERKSGNIKACMQLRFKKKKEKKGSFLPACLLL